MFKPFNIRRMPADLHCRIKQASAATFNDGMEDLILAALSAYYPSEEEVRAHECVKVCELAEFAQPVDMNGGTVLTDAECRRVAGGCGYSYESIRATFNQV